MNGRVDKEHIHNLLMSVWHRDCSADDAYIDIENMIAGLEQSCGDYYEGFEEGFNALVDTRECNAMFETVDSKTGITGSTSVPIKRVEVEDDDSITVVIDYWPK